MRKKLLRACLVQDGQVTQEQRIRRRKSLSIGSHPKNTFVVSGQDTPRSHRLFVFKSGRYQLVLTDAMRGQISVGGEDAKDLRQLIASGVIERRGDRHYLPLNDHHRGKIILGDSTLIFHFVLAPPVPTKPELPASMVASLRYHIDRHFVMALALALAVELPLLFYFHFAPDPEPITLYTMDERWAKLIAPDLNQPDTRGPDRFEDDDRPKPRDKPKASRDNEVKDRADDESKPGEVRQKRRKKARDSVAGKGLLAILGTTGSGDGHSAVADVFNSGGIDTELDEAFEGISGVGVAERGKVSSRGTGSGTAASIGGLATSGGGRVSAGEKMQTRVAAVKTEEPQVVDGSLDQNAISKVVRRRIKSLQDCYERELKRDTGLSGKIEVEFTIGLGGRVDDARVSNNRMGSNAVGACLISRISRWRFPDPDGGRVTVNYPFIFTPSG